MPFRTGTSPFEPGDDDMADFIENIWRPFATDAKVSGGLAWIEQAPTASGRGSHPNFNYNFSRGTVGSEAPPFISFQTTAKTLYIFSGSGVNIGQEPYDQPGNPMNHPPDAIFSDPGNIGQLSCLALNTVVGPYSGYWLFGGPTGEYLHCVLKVSAREYRHFHVGMLSPLDPDLHADSFYVTNHRWAWLDPDDLTAGTHTTNTDSKEHQPYQISHHLPFKNNNASNITFGSDVRSCGMWVYSPLYGTENYDWHFMTGTEVTANAGAVIGRAQNSNGNYGPATNMTKTIGDVNSANNSVLMATGTVSGYDLGLGAIPFACDPTFTTDGVALVPIYVLLHSDFASALRWAPVAQIPDVYRVNMKTLDAEEEISIGSDTYVVFPMMNKDSANTLAGEGYSGFEGLAYKKITADAT